MMNPKHARKASKSSKPKAGNTEAAGSSSDERTGKPETSKPEAGKPETSKPEVGKPETSEPETSEPEIGKPETIKLRANIETLLRNMGVTPRELAAITAFHNLDSLEKISFSKKVIQDSIIDAIEKPDSRFSVAIAESESLLKGYATLDEPHRAEIQKFIKQTKDYLRDSTRKRPLNTLMLAAPGAGKSHFIKQIARALEDERVQAVTFNMATMQSAADLAQPIDELRNIKVNDKFPLLFLDEFDSEPARYAALLPLLWDGELQVGHRDLKLGKSVIVLAGSSPALPKAMDQSARMRLETETAEASVGKLLDLLSRINGGVINIPDLDLRSAHRDRRVDKVCVAVGLIKARFGTDVTKVPRSLLRFIAHTTFRYGVRSIAHLVDLIEREALRERVLHGEELGLPMTSEDELQNSSLRLHLLDKDQGFGIVNRWKEFSKDDTTASLKESASMLSNLLYRATSPSFAA